MEIEKLLEAFKESGIEKSIDYEKFSGILISHHSTAIEGSSLTYQESSLLLTDGLTAKGKPLNDQNMVKDHFDALNFILDEAKKQTPVTPDFIRLLASKVMKTTGGEVNVAVGSFDTSKGDFRKCAVRVGERYFAAYQKVPDKVQEICDMINKRLSSAKTPQEIYDLAFDAHFRLVSVHPFGDGNGRTSRLLMNYILALKNQPLVCVYKEDKAEYFEALEKCREGEENDTQPIINFLYGQLEKYLEAEMQKYNEAEKE